MAIHDVGNPPIFDAIAPQTNPAAGDVLADTGELRPGIYDVRLFVGGSAVTIADVQRRNAANGANVGDVMTVRSVAGQTSEWVLRYQVEAKERIRIVVNTAPGIGNTIEAAIQAEALT